MKLKLVKVQDYEYINPNMVIQVEGRQDVCGDDETIITLVDGSIKVLMKSINETIEWLRGVEE